jgi:GAF domain-containing protein
MTENEVLFKISNIVNGRVSFTQAMEQIGGLLTSEANGKLLTLENSDEAVRMLESLNQPYRSLYSVELRDGGETLGKATLCFASHRFEGGLQQRLADFVGEQLGMLLARTRLAERRAELRDEIARIEEDLATRKVMQRAEGILIAKRGMAAAVAERWIAQQSQRTGLTKRDVADRIIAYHQASGLLEKRIA